MGYGNPTISTTTATYPFAAMSSSNTNLVYNGASLYAGIFDSQSTNLVSIAPDMCKLLFQSSESLLNAKGRIYGAVYYQPPNKSFALSATQTFDATTTAITTT